MILYLSREKGNTSATIRGTNSFQHLPTAVFTQYGDLLVDSEPASSENIHHPLSPKMVWHVLLERWREQRKLPWEWKKATGCPILEKNPSQQPGLSQSPLQPQQK